MDEKDSTFSISLWAAVGGAALAGVVGVPLYFWSKWAIYVVALCFFGLEISALIAGARERRTKSGKIGLIASVIGILLAVAAVWTTGFKIVRMPPELIGLFMVFPCITIAAMAVFSGIIAVAVRKGRRINTWMPLLTLWLGPVAFITGYLLLAFIFDTSSRMTVGQVFTLGSALLSGP